jgi:hypothetical protein
MRGGSLAFEDRFDVAVVWALEAFQVGMFDVFEFAEFAEPDAIVSLFCHVAEIAIKGLVEQVW